MDAERRRAQQQAGRARPRVPELPADMFFEICKYLDFPTLMAAAKSGTPGLVEHARAAVADHPRNMDSDVVFQATRPWLTTLTPAGFKESYYNTNKRRCDAIDSVFARFAYANAGSDRTHRIDFVPDRGSDSMDKDQADYIRARAYEMRLESDTVYAHVSQKKKKKKERGKPAILAVTVTMPIGWDAVAWDEPFAPYESDTEDDEDDGYDEDGGGFYGGGGEYDEWDRCRAGRRRGRCRCCECYIGLEPWKVPRWVADRYMAHADWQNYR